MDNSDIMIKKFELFVTKENIKLFNPKERLEDFKRWHINNYQIAAAKEDIKKFVEIWNDWVLFLGGQAFGGKK